VGSCLNKLSKCNKLGSGGTKSGSCLTKLTNWGQGDKLVILSDQVDQMWQAGVRGKTWDSVRPNWSNVTSGGQRGQNLNHFWPSWSNVTSWDQGRHNWDPVRLSYPNVTRLGQRYKTWILLDQVDKLRSGKKIRFCLTKLIKCDQRGSEGTKLESCLNKSYPFKSAQH
jgi:hypothetical protein